MLADPSRRSFTAKWFASALALVLFVLPACGDSAVDGFEPTTIPLADVASLARLSTGEVVAGDRLTGTIYRFSLAEPDSDPVVIGRVPVSTDGQRGLLGLAVDDTDRIFAAWTNPDDQLVVGEVIVSTPTSASTSSSASASSLAPGQFSETRLVWNGFASSTGANGGHLELLADGRLAIGVGTLRRSALIDDPEAVNGKMLAIDPAGDADQDPAILSSGWKNPFAFTVTEAGRLWVADNEPEDGSSERIGRGDLAQSPRLDVEGQLAPAALIELGPNRLGVCSFITGEMRTITLADDGFGATQPGSVLLSGCRTAALVIDESWILTADLEQLQLQPMPN